MSQKVLFVLKGYPRLSETFIAEEILALEQRGMALRIAALRRPTDGRVHPVHREIRAPVTYLPEYLHHAPLRVLRAWWRLRGTAGYRRLMPVFRADLARDLSRNRLRRLGQALVLAAEIDPAVGRLHAHFIHTPASVTRYAAILTGLPWSVSAHAKDIWTSPDWELREKLGEARFAVTCTRAGAARLQSLAPPGTTVNLVYHGLRLDRFRPLAGPPSRRDGCDPAEPVRLLAVGRAVEKKGFDVLVAALGRLDGARAWTLTHIGGGPQLPRLKAAAEAAGIAGRITWRGACDQTEVLEAYRQADLFVLPCRIAADGDRDGLPNVLVEAQSQGLACVSTSVGGVTELLVHGETGLVVPPEDPMALTEALDQLIGDPEQRRSFGRAGCERVHRLFDSARATAALAALFDDETAATPARSAAE